MIGRSGATINRIQSASSSRLNVVPEPELSAWAPVYIKGAPEGAFTAARLIDELVDELDDAVAEFQLSAKARGALRHGALAQHPLCDEGPASLLSQQVKRISAETGVRVRVPPPGRDAAMGGRKAGADDAEAVTQTRAAPELTNQERDARVWSVYTLRVFSLSRARVSRTRLARHSGEDLCVKGPPSSLGSRARWRTCGAL